MDEVAEAIEKYHGLVPLVYDIETMGLAEARPQDMYYAVYLKREADKVIAELEDCIRDYSENEKNLVIANLDMQRRERHHKHKRCLNKAEWCDTKADWYYGIGESFRDRVKFYIKWRDKWLKLAEQFKEGV